MKQSLIIIFLLSLWACKKDTSSLGIPNVFMPQALNVSGGINANYPVPTGTDSSTYNYSIDTAAGKLNVMLGVAQASTLKAEGYTVNIVTDADTIALLKFNNILDNKTVLMPASMYTLPTTVSVPAGQRAATFSLALDIAQLKSTDYAGKKLALAVRLQSAGKYEVAANAAVTIVIVDVDALVIGPSKDISAQYLKNTSTPFTVAGMHPGGRWGTLSDWMANTAAKSHDGYGGYASDEGGTIDMESGWGSPAIHNGKIWQTTGTALPAGTYTLDVSDLDWQGTKDPTYIVVAPGLDTIPDYANVSGNTTVYSTLFSSPKITFTLTQETKVTVGFVVNYVQDQQGFKIYSVKLMNYPKHL